MHSALHRLLLVSVALLLGLPLHASPRSTCPGVLETQEPPLRVFIFAGQSNMEGADSKVEDIARFPPFAGLGEPRPDVRFSYCIGRDDKSRSTGWQALAPVRNWVGPELSFARALERHTDAPIAIIKVAAGGTHLGGDWNPDEPSGFEMYPLALDWVRSALADLDREGTPYVLEGFMWHQGENDMFVDEYRENYGPNLANFLAAWRRDLGAPELPFYIGELCTKTIWGMDLRPWMHAISVGQREVTSKDPNATYVPTSHVGVEIGDGVGLHYHYGTLGQLQHGEAYAKAYFERVGPAIRSPRPLDPWPYPRGSKVRLFILAGHRNMEGERAFVQELADLEGGAELLEDRGTIAYRYDLGGGYHTSKDWEPLGPAGLHETFGPELSLASTLEAHIEHPIALAKFTHSGSQIIDWTPEGSEAVTRNLYPAFLDFVRSSVEDLESRGHAVELEGIFYHLGENDMSWGRFRKGAATRLQSFVNQSRVDLEAPELRWYVSQQPPTNDPGLNEIDVVAQVAEVATADPLLIHIRAFDLPAQPKQLVLNTAGVVALGRLLARGYLETR